MSVIVKGRLVRWKEDKGFGFIQSEQTQGDVFIHISAFNNSPRRPVIGDVIYYQLHVANDGKIKAVNAEIENVAGVKPPKTYNHPQKSNHNRSFPKLFPLLLIIAIGCFLYVAIAQYHPNQTNGSPQQAISSSHDFILQDAFEHQISAIQVEGVGKISKLLPDDTVGAKHQKIIVVLNSGQTILIAHNIDIADKIDPIQLGDFIAFNGEYEWNEKGGLVHWTHLDPKGIHIAGWLKYNGKKYQ
jgi:cold shock CspA family protein